MATSVKSAFEEFMQNFVRLDAGVTSNAKASRNSLKAQLDRLSSNGTLPNAYAEKHIDFGSFARKTKIREIDDIDLMHCMSAMLCTYFQYEDKSVDIYINNDDNPFLEFCNDGTKLVNSTKILNNFKSNLSSIPHYSRSEIHRTGESVSLTLSSYGWTFDIVPCFFTRQNVYGVSYYIIPDGAGRWKMTDPRKDKDRVSTINTNRSGKVLDAIRILKYWNRRKRIETLSSYLVENLVLNYFSEHSESSYIDIDVAMILDYISRAIYSPVEDPKGIQGDLNRTGINSRVAISKAAAADHKTAIEAICQKIKEKDHKEAISTWRTIFGDDFPKWG